MKIKKKLTGVVASILVVCMLTLGAFAASASVTISKGQSSVTSSAVGLAKKATFTASNYSSSVELMQVYGMASVPGKGFKVVYQRSMEPGDSCKKTVTRLNQSSFKIQIVGSYYCNGKGRVTTG